jgi:hypothetical protein
MRWRTKPNKPEWTSPKIQKIELSSSPEAILELLQEREEALKDIVRRIGD